MRTALVIGPDFAPSSLPPALRIRFFCNHLSGFGWQPVVLAVDPRHYESEVDPDNTRLVDPSVEVVRIPAFSPGWTRKFGFGDLSLRCFWQTWRKAVQICRRRPIDIVFIPVPPYFSILHGRLLRSRFGIPYVIDYIDPWIIADYWKLPKSMRPPKWALADAASRWLEPVALRRVSHIVGVSQGTVDQVRAPYAWIGPDDVAAIPYGGEPADFANLRQKPRPNPIFDKRDGLFHLTYTGAFIPGMHATAQAVFAAVRTGLKRRPELFGRLRLHFVGTSYAPGGDRPLHALRLAREEGIEGNVSETPERIPYLSALQTLLDSQALLAVGSDAPHYTASKLFPYLLAEKPILAVFHEASSVVSILRDTGAGIAVTYGAKTSPGDRVEEIGEALERILSGIRTPGVSLDEFAPYTARAMSRRLAAVFDKVAERGAGRDGLAT